jgi:hypothetical protein
MGNEFVEKATVLSVHRTSQGLVRYRQWPHDLITVEVLEAAWTVAANGRRGIGESPEDRRDEHCAPRADVEPAPTWQICAMVAVRRMERTFPTTDPDR